MARPRRRSHQRSEATDDLIVVDAGSGLVVGIADAIPTTETTYQAGKIETQEEVLDRLRRQHLQEKQAVLADMKMQLALAEGLLERVTERHRRLMSKKDTIQVARDASYAKVRKAQDNLTKAEHIVMEVRSAVELLLLPGEPIEARSAVALACRFPASPFVVGVEGRLRLNASRPRNPISSPWVLTSKA